MIELLAIAGGGWAMLVVIGDVIADGPGYLWRQAETLRMLSRFMVTKITAVRQGDQARIDAWLQEPHAGTADISPEDQAFFATQLELARKEVGK